MSTLYTIQAVIDRIPNVFRKKNITTISLPSAKIENLLHTVEPLYTPEICNTPCECEKLYIGQTTRGLSGLGNLSASIIRGSYSLEKASNCWRPQILFDKIEVLAKSWGYSIKDNLNRDRGFKLRRIGRNPVFSKQQHRSNTEEISYHPHR